MMSSAALVSLTICNQLMLCDPNMQGLAFCLLCIVLLAYDSCKPPNVVHGIFLYLQTRLIGWQHAQHANTLYRGAQFGDRKDGCCVEHNAE